MSDGENERTRWTVHETTLRWFNAEGLEFICLLHRQHDGFHQFFDLLLQTTNISVCFGGALVDLHRLYPGVEFGWKFVEYEIRVLVDTDEIGRLELFGRDETDEGEEYGLSSGCLYYCAFAFAHRVEVLVCTVLFRIGVDIQNLESDEKKEARMELGGVPRRHSRRGREEPCSV